MTDIKKEAIKARVIDVRMAQVSIYRLILGVRTCNTHQWRKTKKTKKSR